MPRHNPSHFNRHHSGGNQSKRGPVLCLCAVWWLGCTPSMPTVKPVRFTELTEQAMSRLPMVIEVRKGDQIPVKINLRGNMLESPADAKPIMLTAKRRFFVVVQGDAPPRISLDGATLGSLEKKGSVSLGIHQETGKTPEVTVDLSQSYENTN